MKKIPLTFSKFAVIDRSDYDLVSKYKWHLQIDTYTSYAASKINGKIIKLHRFIMDCPPLLEVDHKNGNGLDNRRCNLRVCTKSQNQLRRQIYRKTSSRYRGVSWCKNNKKWRVQARISGKKFSIGYFHNEIAAAKKYNEIAIKHHGDFAYLNFKKPKQMELLYPEIDRKNT